MEGRKCLSFFSGALGLDTGLERAGFEVIFHNESDPTTAETIRLNRPGVPLYAGDIRDLSAHEVLQRAKVSSGGVFLMCGGPPCQAFSTAGKRLGLNDDRGNAFLKFIELIGEIRPKYFLMENVRGLLSAPLRHRPHQNRGVGFSRLASDEEPGGALRLIITRLTALGYGINFNLYNMANYGIPQSRERIVFFGSRDGAAIPHVPPTHAKIGGGDLPPWLTVQAAIDDLPEPGPCGKFSEARLRFFRMLRAGQNWKHLPSDLQAEALGKSFYSTGGRVGFYRRVAWDKPAPTLVTSPTMPATDLAHPEEDRPLSVREYARLQTFADSWIFAGSLADQYRQIGNAVPVAFGHTLGRHLLAFDTGTLETPLFPFVTSRYKNCDLESWSKVGQARS